MNRATRYELRNKKRQISVKRQTVFNSSDDNDCSVTSTLVQCIYTKREV